MLANDHSVENVAENSTDGLSAEKEFMRLF
jgi:hypothetical protein